jgi:DNA topoisomerase IA
LTSTHEIPSWNISNLYDRGFYSVKLSNNLSSNLGCHLDSVLKKKRINVKEYNILQDFLESDLDEIRQHQESYLPFIVDTRHAIKYVEERRKLEEK